MKKFAAFLVVILIFSIIFTQSSTAADFRAFQNISISEEETIDDDLYIAGGNLNFTGLVEGDLLVAGGNVFISGEITENLMVAGGSITVAGDTGRAVRLTGGSVDFSGSSVSDAVIASPSVNITPEASIGNDLAVFAESVSIAGDVDGNIEIRAREVVLNGFVAGNADIETENLTIGNTASLNGNLNYTSPQEAEIDDTANIAGEISFTQEDYDPLFAGFDIERPAFLWPFFWLGNVLMTLVSALVISFVFKRQTRSIITNVADSFWENLLRGFIVVIIIPATAIIVAITVFGIPIAFIGIISYILFLVLSFILSGVAAGALIAKKWRGTDYIIDINWKIVIGGVLLLSLISAIPVIGWFVRAAFVLAVLGALFLLFQNSVWRRRREEETEKLIA